MVPDRRIRERFNLALALGRNRPAHSMGRRDSTLFFEGDERDDIYLLKSGAVRFCRYSEDGQRTVGGFAVGGELFSLAVDGRHIYTAEFAADSEYLAVSRRAGVDDQSDDRIARRLQHFLADEPWYMNEVFTDMLHRSSSERLAFFLMDLGLRRLGRLVDGSTFPVGIPRRDIVDFLGLRAETVSRTYTGLAKAGAAVEKFGQVTVLSVSRLRSAAGAGKLKPEVRMIDRRWGR